MNPFPSSRLFVFALKHSDQCVDIWHRLPAPEAHWPARRQAHMPYLPIPAPRHRASAPAFANFEAGFSITDGGDDEFGMYPYNDIGGNGFSIWYNGETLFSGGGTAPADGSFHDFVFRSNGATDHEIFVDGVSEGTSVTSKTMIGTIDTVNTGSFGGFEFYTGNLQGPIIWLRGLTDDEIINISLL